MIEKDKDLFLLLANQGLNCLWAKRRQLVAWDEHNLVTWFYESFYRSVSQELHPIRTLDLYLSGTYDKKMSR